MHVITKLMYRCVDYVRVTRMGGAGGVTESCGSVTENKEQIDNGEKMPRKI